MEEKILNARKNGMAVLLLTLLGYAASIPVRLQRPAAGG